MTSPKKLQRSIRNQVIPSSPSADCDTDALTLSLRRLNLSPPSLPCPQLSAILVQSQSCSRAITTLDLSHSLLEPRVLATLCLACRELQCFVAVDCSLSETLPDTQWPHRLHTVDLSRNSLHKIPHGFDKLLYLKRLNLNGNKITFIPPALLNLPTLDRLYLLRNPIQNIPKAICRDGVEAMRRFLQLKPLPMPFHEFSTDTCLAVRRRLLKDNCNLRLESCESGYDSSTRHHSSASSCSLDSEGDKDGPPLMPSLWPDIACTDLPHDYKEVSSSCNLCKLYLSTPAEISAHIQIEEIKDHSLYPRLASNELLVTPVVRVSPHGMRFNRDRSAVLLLHHCLKSGGAPGEEFTVMCSNTDCGELPQWERLEEETCDMFQNQVKFSTSHFSLFAVISTFPYHSAQVVISSNKGGSLALPNDCPGFKVTLPIGCVAGREETVITAKVYYADLPHPSSGQGNPDLPLASPIVGLEPHGLHFSQPVEVTLPVPDYAAITAALPQASLQLWTAPFDGLSWNHMDDTQLTVNHNGDVYTASFSLRHFSFFELLWNTCKDTLVRLQYGAGVLYQSMRTRYVGVRCQVFMTPPQQDLSFALLVVVYKFGDLKELGNYPWMLADSGERSVFLKTGELEATLNGSFLPREECGEYSLSQSRTLEYTGQDFSLRFAFSLKLTTPHPQLSDYQVIGKLTLRQGTTTQQLNLIKVQIYSVKVVYSVNVSLNSYHFSHQELHLESHPHQSSTQHGICHILVCVEHGKHCNDVKSSLSTDTPPLSPNEEGAIESDLSPSLSSVPTTQRCRGPKRRPLTPILDHQSQSKRMLVMKSDRDLNDRLFLDIAKRIGPKYYDVGILLGLKSDTIHSVAGAITEGQGEYMKAFHVLQEWKRVAAENLTFETLITALKDAELNTIAHELCHEVPITNSSS